MKENEQVTWGQLGREILSPFRSEGYYLMRSIVIQVIMAFTIALILCWITPITIENALYAGALTWTIVLFFTPVFKTFFVNIPANHGAVFSNEFRSYEKPVEGSTKLPETRMLREVGPGWQGKLPWETFLSNDPKFPYINLQRKVPIGGKITVYTKDNVPYEIEFAVFLTALRGYLCNFVRLFDEGIALFFQAQFKQYLLNKVSMMDDKEFKEALAPDESEVDPGIHKHGKISKGFNTLFGGKDVISPTEKEFGTFTNNPAITSIVIDPSFKDVLAGKKRGDVLKQVAAEIKAGNTDMDPDLAVITAAGAMNMKVNAKYDRVKVAVTGLENLRHLSGAGGLGLGLGEELLEDKSGKPNNKKDPK